MKNKWNKKEVLESRGKQTKQLISIFAPYTITCEVDDAMGDAHNYFLNSNVSGIESL